QIVRDYLCIQATNVALKQAFLVAGLVISPLRNRLKAEIARNSN
ncbi:15923_t:CDS:2, partial [Funneliformis mosseae]